MFLLGGVRTRVAAKNKAGQKKASQKKAGLNHPKYGLKWLAFFGFFKNMVFFSIFVAFFQYFVF